MVSESINVKSKGKIVATTEYQKCDTLEEAVDAYGEATVLADTNKRVRTNAMNLARQKAVGAPSLKAHRKAALGQISTEEFQSIAGDADALEALVARKAAVIAAEEEDEGTDEGAADEDED